MPSKTCSVCGEKVVIPQKDWKYTHSSTNFICSKECLLARIKYFGDCNNPSRNYHPSINLDPAQLSRASSHTLGLSFRSEFEAAVAEYLHTCALDFLYEPYSFDVEGHSYTPDFYIESPYDCFIEVKGVFGIGGKRKLTTFLALYPEVNFIYIPWTMRDEFVNANFE